MTPEDRAYEDRRREELFAIAAEMTALGLPGADPDDPYIALLLKTGLEATQTHEELVEWLARRKPK